MFIKIASMQGPRCTINFACNGSVMSIKTSENKRVDFTGDGEWYTPRHKKLVLAIQRLHDAINDALIE